MNLIHSPLHEATSALSGWMASKSIRVDVDPDAEDNRMWVLSRPEGDGSLVLRTYAHLDAIALSFRISLPPAPRLVKLELLAHLNETIAWPRFWLDRGEDLIGEYMLDCKGETLPSALAPMITRMLELPDAVIEELSGWQLDATDAMTRSDGTRPRVQ